MITALNLAILILMLVVFSLAWLGFTRVISAVLDEMLEDERRDGCT
jgi:hypothetical protein